MSKTEVQRLNGTVHWYEPRRGYGFINGEDGSSYYVHHSEIVDNTEGFRKLKKGQKVSFYIGEPSHGHSVAIQVTGQPLGTV